MLLLTKKFTVKNRLSHALRTRYCKRSKTHVRILSRNKNCSCPLSSCIARGREGESSASGKGSRAVRLGYALGFFFECLAVHILSFPRSFLKEERTRRCPGCIPARAYFNINNWRANFPRARARVISGRRDGDASVCDRDPAASRRLKYSFSLLRYLFLRFSAFRVAILLLFLLSFLWNFMFKFLSCTDKREQKKFASY